MKIVEPYARLIHLTEMVQFYDPSTQLSVTSSFYEGLGINLLRKIEWCGRISHRSEDHQTADSWRRFITAVVLEHGDWSIVEHASVSVDMLVDRGITHELVRHRLFSFTQESTRFVNYEKKMEPSFIRPQMPSMYCGSDVGGTTDVWYEAIESAESSYRNLVQCGVSPQIARSVLPNALASRIIVTGNLRNWRLFLLMRTTKETHPQMRQVTIPLLAEFQSSIPLLFDDITPEARQIDNMRKPR